MSGRRTILQVGAFPFPLHQGSQVYAGGMARAQARAGHRVLFAAYGHGRGPWPEGVERVPVPRLPGDAVERSGPHLAKPLLDAVLAAAVARVLRREPVDVIHAHNVEAPLVGALARRVARRCPKLVYNLHTSLEEELPVYWTSGLRGRVAAPLGRAVDGFLPPRVDGCVALSDRGATLLRDRGARAVLNVPPGVDLDELAGGDAGRARHRWDLGEGAWILYAGNTDPYQDLDDLLCAMVEVPEAGLLVITGSDTDDVRARARRAGLPAARLRVVGSTDFADTRDGLAVAAAAAVPRTVCAGFPIKLLNLLGAGLPTVVAQGSAPAVEGVLPVPDHAPAAMAGALRSIVQAPAMSRRLGEAARRAVASRYGWDRTVARLDGWYATL